MTSKIDAIKQELSGLKDGKSFTASMTIKEARIAIDGLNLDDREFSLNQDGQQISVTCHYTKESINEMKALGLIVTATVGALLMFALLQTALYEQDKADEAIKIEVAK